MMKKLFLLLLLAALLAVPALAMTQDRAIELCRRLCYKFTDDEAYIADEIRRLVETLRREIPDICLRTTLSSGFPGETPEQHAETAAFVEEIGFDRLGAFPYSPEDGTPAATFPNQIPEEEKTARYNELMELQQEVSLSRQARFVGKTLDVLIDAVDEETGERIGRSYRDAPEIDGEVTVSGAESALPGDMIRVRITGSSEYDLSGEMIHE